MAEKKLQRRTISIQPHPQGWKVEVSVISKSDVSTTSSFFSTKLEAVEQAHEICKAYPSSELAIHGEDGRMESISEFESQGDLPDPPSLDDLVGLSRWALVAFAARCASLTLQLYRQQDDTLKVVKRTIRAAEESAFEPYSPQAIQPRSGTYAAAKPVSYDTVSEVLAKLEEVMPRIVDPVSGMVARSARYAAHSALNAYNGNDGSAAEFAAYALSEAWNGATFQSRGRLQLQLISDLVALKRETVRNGSTPGFHLPRKFFDPPPANHFPLTLQQHGQSTMSPSSGLISQAEAEIENSRPAALVDIYFDADGMTSEDMAKVQEFISLLYQDAGGAGLKPVEVELLEHEAEVPCHG